MSPEPGYTKTPVRNRHYSYIIHNSCSGTCLDVPPPHRLWHRTSSPINHLHIDYLLYARLPHHYSRTPWVIVPSSAISTVPLPFIVSCCLQVPFPIIVDVRLVRLDGCQCNHTIAVRVLRPERPSSVGGLGDGRLDGWTRQRGLPTLARGHAFLCIGSDFSDQWAEDGNRSGNYSSAGFSSCPDCGFYCGGFGPLVLRWQVVEGQGRYLRLRLPALLEKRRPLRYTMRRMLDTLPTAPRPMTILTLIFERRSISLSTRVAIGMSTNVQSAITLIMP